MTMTLYIYIRHSGYYNGKFGPQKLSADQLSLLQQPVLCVCVCVGGGGEWGDNLFYENSFDIPLIFSVLAEFENCLGTVSTLSRFNRLASLNAPVL